MLSGQGIETMAELMWMNETGDSKAWKGLDEEAKDLCRKNVVMFEKNLGKIDLEIRPAGEFKMSRKNLTATKEELTRFIKAYMTELYKDSKSADLKQLADLFPHGELAVKIANQYGPEKTKEKKNAKR